MISLYIFSDMSRVVSVTGQMSGDTATYSCDSGYELDGNTTRICQADGSWTESASICVGMNTMSC